MGGARGTGDPYPLRLHLQLLRPVAREEKVHPLPSGQASLPLPLSAPGKEEIVFSFHRCLLSICSTPV